jgi:glycosyltransferase involved in cell wall biosynthesis
VDDGSTDNSAEVARSSGAQVISMGATLGVGAGLQTDYEYAVQHGYDVAVTVAGNNKDSPEEIPLLLDPIAENRADFVQGSRFLKRASNFGPCCISADCYASPIHCSFRWSPDAGRCSGTDGSNFRGDRTIQSCLADQPRLHRCAKQSDKVRSTAESHTSKDQSRFVEALKSCLLRS